MTKEEAATEEVRTDTKTDSSSDTPAKDADASSTKASEGETATTNDTGQSDGEGKDASKESGDKKDDFNKSSKKRKWFWSKKGEQAGAEAAGGQPGDGNQHVSEDKESPADNLSEAEMEAELQRRIRELETEKEKLGSRIEMYNKYDTLMTEVSNMSQELDRVITRHKNNRSKSESEGTVASKPSAQ